MEYLFLAFIFGVVLYVPIHFFGKLHPKFRQTKSRRLHEWRKQHAEYLQSDHWKSFSKKMRTKAGICQVDRCEVVDIPSLHTHHLHYNSVGKEKPKDVKVLCEKHHSMTHSGKTLILKELKPFGRQ
jgi:hypothetical protein